MVRKFEKRSSSSHGEVLNNCALAHCRCNNAAENFDRHVTQMLCQNYSRQDLFQDSLVLKALAFRAVQHVWSSLLARLRVRDRNYLNVRFILRISKATLISGFSWLVKNRAYFGSVQNTKLLEVFFARTELLTLAVVDSLVLIGQKRDRDKTRLFSVAVRDFCSWPIRACLSRTVSSSAH